MYSLEQLFAPSVQVGRGPSFHTVRGPFLFEPLQYVFIIVWRNTDSASGVLSII
jgi:hypothetical protein